MIPRSPDSPHASPTSAPIFPTSESSQLLIPKNPHRTPGAIPHPRCSAHALRPQLLSGPPQNPESARAAPSRPGTSFQKTKSKRRQPPGRTCHETSSAPLRRISFLPGDPPGSPPAGRTGSVSAFCTGSGDKLAGACLAPESPNPKRTLR